MAKPAIGYQHIWVSLLLIAPHAGAADQERSAFRGTLFGTYVPPMAEVERRYGIKNGRLLVNAQKPVAKKLRRVKPQKFSLGPLRGRPDPKLKPNRTKLRKPTAPIRRSIADEPIITGATTKPPSFTAKPTKDGNNPKPQSAKNDNNNFEFEASIAGSIGYDTNIDEDSDSAGSPFHRYDANMSASYDADGLELKTNGELVLIKRTRDDSFSEWKLAGAISANRDFGKGRSGGFGFSFESDSSDADDVSIENKAFVETAVKNSLATLELRGDVSYEVDASDQSSDDDEDESDTPDDLLESGIMATARYRPEKTISPFLRLGLTDVYYTRQDVSALNRDALAANGVFGLRLNPNEKFRIDVAARYDQRFLYAAGISGVNNLSAEVDFEWKPTDEISIKGAMKQFLDNPGSSDATYAKSTKYELEATWSPNELTELEFSGEYERSVEPEVNEATKELTLEAKIARKLNDRLSIFSALEQKWSTEKARGLVTEKYNRTEIRAGVEVRLLE